MTVLARTLNTEAAGLTALFAKMVGTLETWKNRADARREMAELSFREIQDIGLDQALLEQEIAKPFWRA